jgi:hypothetical protein
MMFLNLLMDGASIRIGMKLCPAPQISEHCPTMMLGWLIISWVWLIRPGVASTFVPRHGIVHEWITSFDVISICVGVLIGMIRWFDVSSSRISFLLFNVDVIGELLIWLYSYDQYHWNPIVLIVREGIILSSNINSVFIDGMAMNIRIIAGIEVQKNSISWASSRYRLKFFVHEDDVIVIKDSVVMEVRMIIEWS